MKPSRRDFLKGLVGLIPTTVVLPRLKPPILEEPPIETTLPPWPTTEEVERWFRGALEQPDSVSCGFIGVWQE